MDMQVLTQHHKQLAIDITLGATVNPCLAALTPTMGLYVARPDNDSSYHVVALYEVIGRLIQHVRNGNIIEIGLVERTNNGRISISRRPGVNVEACGRCGLIPNPSSSGQITLDTTSYFHEGEIPYSREDLVGRNARYYSPILVWHGNVLYVYVGAIPVAAFKGGLLILNKDCIL